MKIFAVTLNCYKIQFYDKSTFDWLSDQLVFSLDESEGGAPDLIAVAFQEFLPFDKAFSYGNDEYEASIQELLLSAIRKGLQGFPQSSSLPRSSRKSQRKKEVPFKFIKMERHVGNALYIFGRPDLMPSDASGAKLGLGWFWLGNKGAVAIRLAFKGKDRDGKVLNWSVCFLSCHLDSHKTNSQARNFQFQELSSKILFEEDTESAVKKYSPLEEQDAIIILGDLNYRVYDPTGDRHELIKLHSDGRIKELLAFDQLSKEFSESSDNFLARFTEAPITFLPTYKYVPGSEKLDSSRIPSWCDRILISSPFSVYRFFNYFSVPSCHLSDHLPVIAILELLPRPISHTKRNAESKLIRTSTPDPFLNLKKNIGLVADKLVGLFFFVWERFFLLPSFIASLILILGVGCAKAKLF